MSTVVLLCVTRPSWRGVRDDRYLSEGALPHVGVGNDVAPEWKAMNVSPKIVAASRTRC